MGFVNGRNTNTVNGRNPNKKPPPGQRLTKEQLREIFIQFDENNDQLLSKSELKKAFNYLGAHYPGYRASQSINHADADGDGFVDFQELDDLVKYASKLGYTVKQK